MAYQALYREYRPRRFDEIVGQSHISSVLRNQILSGRASHAYLFCGSRGTGKTSTAKIFARSVNCLDPVEGEACGRCESCAAMREEVVDIIEIDAASNNGVDDVRALIEQARFTPLRLKRKVYIIDEVHMLSGAASNALLKTLEEPPSHVIFLLATTEPQKLLPTVISRCQRFDFKRISIVDIVGNLKNVLRQTGAEVDEEGLLTIARAADGGMRDALSLMDQCISFCGDKISVRDVNEVLGIMDADFLFNIADALIDSRADKSLVMLDDIVSSGKDLLVFSQDLTQHLRAVLLAKECGDCHTLLDCTIDTMRRYEEQAKRASQQRLLRALELITKAQNEMKWLGRPRVLLETTLVSICRPEDEATIAALMDRVERLERSLEEMPARMSEAACVKEAKPQPPVRGKTANEKQGVKKAGEKAADQRKEEGASSGDEIWDKLQKLLQKNSPSLFVISRKVERAACENGVLTLYFPEANRGQYDMLKRHQSEIQEALSALDAHLRLSLSISSNKTNDKETDMLKDFFGEKLRIE